MTKPKILHIATALSWRGGEQQVAYLLTETKNEVQNFVLCSEGSKMAAFCSERNIHFFEQTKKGGIDLTYARRIKSICKQQQIDLIHVHDAHAHTFSILAAILFGNKTGIVLSRRVDFPIKKNWFSRLKYNHGSIRKILCVSDTIKEITAQGIKEKTKLTTVYSGIDLAKFQARNRTLKEELKLPEDAFLVVNTSALADHKDYFTFIDVAEKVIEQREDTYFLIMGEGPMEQELKAYARTKKVKKQLQFLGFRNDIPQILAGVDLFLITSKTEGLGTSILDAFACEVPVVGTKGGGIVELIEHEKTGLLCEVKHVEEITHAVFRLLENENLRKELTNNGLSKVQLFSKETTAMSTLRHYRELLSLS